MSRAATWLPSSAVRVRASRHCCVASMDWRPTKNTGAIVVDGIDVGLSAKEGKLRDLRRNVGMVFQQFNLFPHLTAARECDAGAHGREQGAAGRGERACGRNAGQGRIVRQGGQLSVAAFRRPAAACRDCARTRDAAEVLLCDEITSALDPELVNEVLRVVEGLAREGITSNSGDPRDALRPRRRHQAGVHAYGQGA